MRSNRQERRTDFRILEMYLRGVLGGSGGEFHSSADRRPSKVRCPKGAWRDSFRVGCDCWAGCGLELLTPSIRNDQIGSHCCQHPVGRRWISREISDSRAKIRHAGRSNSTCGQKLLTGRSNGSRAPHSRAARALMAQGSTRRGRSGSSGGIFPNSHFPHGFLHGRDQLILSGANEWSVVFLHRFDAGVLVARHL